MASLGDRSALLVLVLAACRISLAQAALSAGHLLQGAELGGSDGSGSGGGGSMVSSGNRRLLAARELQGLFSGGSRDEKGRAIMLYTQFGGIRIRLLEQLAPRVTALVWELAARRGCTSSYNCAFYRNEARPRASLGQDPLGPPYALLQGRLHDLKEDPPFEGNIQVKAGHVCFIPGGKDWFIALSDHPEWGTSHPVWGMVEGWATPDAIIAQQYNNWTHPDHGTVLRILKIEVPFKLAVEGDRAYSDR